MGILAKYGVPLNGVNSGMLHPKQKYRFRVILNNFGNDQFTRELTAQVVSCTRPKIEFETKEIHGYNSRIKFDGKHNWQPIELKLRDDITNAVASAVGAQIQKQFNVFEQTSAVAGINYKFRMEIHSLDGTTRDEIESWVLEGCRLENVSNPDGDYSLGDANEITLSITYDAAAQVAGPNTNDGTVVGGDPFINEPSPTGGTVAEGG